MWGGGLIWCGGEGVRGHGVHLLYKASFPRRAMMLDLILGVKGQASKL